MGEAVSAQSRGAPDGRRDRRRHRGRARAGVRRRVGDDAGAGGIVRGATPQDAGADGVMVASAAALPCRPPGTARVLHDRRRGDRAADDGLQQPAGERESTWSPALLAEIARAVPQRQSLQGVLRRRPADRRADRPVPRARRARRRRRLGARGVLRRRRRLGLRRGRRASAPVRETLGVVQRRRAGGGTRALQRAAAPRRVPT